MINNIGSQGASNNYRRMNLPSSPQEKAQVNTEAQKSEDKQVSSESILSAMDVQASYGRSQVQKRMVNPSDWLTPDRIKDIEASMGVFDELYNQGLVAIDEEFPNLSDGSKELVVNNLI